MHWCTGVHWCVLVYWDLTNARSALKPPSGPGAQPSVGPGGPAAGAHGEPVAGGDGLVRHLLECEGIGLPRIDSRRMWGGLVGREQVPRVSRCAAWRRAAAELIHGALGWSIFL